MISKLRMHRPAYPTCVEH